LYKFGLFEPGPAVSEHEKQVTLKITVRRTLETAICPRNAECLGRTRDEKVGWGDVHHHLVIEAILRRHFAGGRVLVKALLSAEVLVEVQEVV
jgi:predicted NAD-dependent protein-ADP-ribosyltransferase YbiA (DUF1768 family)